MDSRLSRYTPHSKNHGYILLGILILVLFVGIMRKVTPDRAHGVDGGRVSSLALPTKHSISPVDGLHSEVRLTDPRRE